MVKEERRKLAIDIINLFENVLNEHNIKLPDNDRTGDSTEASIFGSTYYEIEDSIENLLCEFDKNSTSSRISRVFENLLNDKETSNEKILCNYFCYDRINDLTFHINEFLKITKAEIVQLSHAVYYNKSDDTTLYSALLLYKQPKN